MTEDKAQPPTAFIVDTNAFGNKIGPKQIADLKELVGKGVDVCVPDVVCLELASHDWESASPIVGRLANLSLLPGPRITATSFNNKISALIQNSGATIRETPLHFYMGAVHAQVLHIAPAKPKAYPGKPNQRVTTGAVDHIIYQHALDLAETHRHVCVITNDGELSRSLSAHPMISTTPSIYDAKNLAKYSRPSFGEALNMASHVMSFEFNEELFRHLKSVGYSGTSIHGVGDILKMDENRTLLTVFAETTDSAGREELDRILVTVAGDQPKIEDWTTTASEPFAYWHLGTIDSIDSYISSELRMLPTELRPVPLIDDTPSPGVPFYLELEGRFAFYIDETELVHVDWSPVTNVHWTHQDDKEFSWEDSFVEVGLFEEGKAMPSQDKGALAAAILRQLQKTRGALRQVQ